MLQQYLENMKQEGQGYDGKLEKMMKDMEQSEKDIVNKNINQNTINRQEEILTRMLESEKAEMKREKEELRESKEGQQLVSPTAKYMEFLQKNKKGQKEMLKKVPIPLKLYYKDKVSKYFINFGG
jgi:septal ring factor EnvC (AmiA/AmiB activator)